MKRSANAILIELAEKQGWNDVTMLDLLCDFIDKYADTDELEGFLCAVASHENAETESEDES